MDYSKELPVELFKSSSQFLNVGINVFVCDVRSGVVQNSPNDS